MLHTFIVYRGVHSRGSVKTSPYFYSPHSQHDRISFSTHVFLKYCLSESLLERDTQTGLSTFCVNHLNLAISLLPEFKYT